MKRMNMSRYVVMAMAALVICLASGCATTDTASARFPELQKNINAAKAADAEVYAPEPLHSAEAKLAEAKLAVLATDMVSANRLIDEAMIDAEYARAMAPTEKSKSDAMKLRESIQAVRDQIMQLPAVK
ncbi:MAG: DUF4398 domain-containing protein [Proteobacteria bacterium]|nr:DUF4398 domain-containing protein [Pseudomonadota bacterium]MBU1639328.1 DUF4398 domain-containing protein [Pseudomonadota bacterium]